MTVRVLVGVLVAAMTAQGADAYLRWSPDQVASIGRSMYQTGQVGGTFDLRVIRTDRSYNYKLAATWLTPDVIRATVRQQMLTGRLDEAAARAMVAESVLDEIAVLVEIDPREGSGVVPDDWVAQLEPRNATGEVLTTVTGTQTPDRRTRPAFQGVRRRDYAYDRFWVTFPTKRDGVGLIPEATTELRLIVRIYDKAGRVTWKLTNDLRSALGLPVR